MAKFFNFLWNNIWMVAVAVLLSTIFIGGPMRASGHSMEPTIHDGSVIYVQKSGYSIQQNDIVVASVSDEDGMPYYIVKRVIGLPGDTVEIKTDGTILVNGRQYENHFDGAYQPGAAYTGRQVVLDENEYFLLGDNRKVSRDSRYIGPVQKKQIKGEVVKIMKGETDPYRLGETL